MRNLSILSALGAILAGTASENVAQWRGNGVGTLRRGQTQKEVKPQWLQDRLIARAAEKRARKAARRLEGR